MAALVAAIHADPWLLTYKRAATARVDGRHKAGHDALVRAHRSSRRGAQLRVADRQRDAHALF
ncbi:MAG: hypothetical protein WAM55_11400, partial [Methylovirgula sp.]